MIEVIFWHGKTKTLEDKISEICKKIDEKYYFLGSMSEFSEKWNDKFIVFRQESFWLIGVTNKSNFGTY